MRIATFVLSAAVLAFASLSQAAVTAIDVTEVAQSEVAGHKTFDITVTGTGQLTGIQMLLNASADGIYQDMFGSDTAPNGLFFPTAPSLEFDTFIGLGGKTSADSLAPIIPGGAVNLGGNAGLTFDTSKLDVTWAPPGASPVNDANDYFVGRITLKEDATGSLLLLGSSFQEDDFTNPAIDLANLLGGGSVDPVAVGDPVSGSTISLQGAFDNGSGLLAEAIMVTNGEPNSDPALTFDASDLVFTQNDEGLFSASINEADSSKIDLMIDVANAGVAPLRDVAAVLEVRTNGGTLTYNLTARVPEPSTFALAGLALVGLVGFTRRK